VTVGEGVATHVHEHDQVGLERGDGGGEALGDRGGAAVRVHEHGLLAKELCHPRLAEADAARAHARVWARGEHARGELAAVGDLRHRARARLGVDRAALPGHAADHGARAVEPGVLGGR
jgi:hypothetical protein